MMMRLFSLGFVLTATSCFSPIFDDEFGVDLTYTVCCEEGAVTTCPCYTSLQSCQERFRSCANGTCMELSNRPSGSCAGATKPTAYESDSGTASHAPPPRDAGTTTTVDAGAMPEDAGRPPITSPDTFEPCCKADGRVSTCRCPGGVCAIAPFVACPRGRCAQGSSTAACPK